ncbi:MAG TPA: 2-C-methyl-D-erythritol 4-phosphate cytidylyltransferase [Epulopiscium sp.]|nr:2-C-methyl-D-erythritol 4-phosphate cytidylyltransferase [Candidatus Epulonipiscium sp.]
MYCSVVIVAAGSGRRMGTEVKKQYLKLNGKEILAHTIGQFEKCNRIDEIILVTGEEEVAYCHEYICKKYGFFKIKNIVAGGKERQDSVYNGLLQVSEQTQIVLIHDGARPLIGIEEIEESIEVASQEGACVVGVPLKDTVKICNDNQLVEQTPRRDTLWIVQTPQTFKYDLIMAAYEAGMKNNIVATDDAMMVEELGYPVKIILGRYDNIKITTPEDLLIAKNMLL